MNNLVQYGILFFNEGTPKEVMGIICNNAHSKNRFRFWFGDKETGKSWNEENDVTGYIGVSAGSQKIPLLIHNRNSIGGGALLTDCIVKIVDTQSKRVLYQHPTFNQSTFSIRDCEVLADNNIYAICVDNVYAQRLADFMNGKRMNK